MNDKKNIYSCIYNYYLCEKNKTWNKKEKSYLINKKDIEDILSYIQYTSLKTCIELKKEKCNPQMIEKYYKENKIELYPLKLQQKIIIREKTEENCIINDNQKEIEESAITLIKSIGYSIEIKKNEDNTKDEIDNNNPELIGNKSNNSRLDNKNIIKDKKFNYCKNLIFILIIVSVIVLLISISMNHLLYKNNNNEEKINENIDNNMINNNNNSSEIKPIMGIKLGTLTSGYAILFHSIDDLQFKNNYDLFPTEIIINKMTEEALFIGRQAKNYFYINSNNKEILYFTRFMRNFDQNNKTNMIESDFPGDEMDLKIIIKEFLRKIREYVKDINYYVYHKELKWIIAIPPLWDIKGKELIEKAANDVGIYNLEVISESEAASLAIFNEDNPTIKKYIKKDKKFLIVDIHENKTDVIAYKILEDNNLEQLIIPMSINYGSSLIDHKIFDIFKKFVGEDKIKDYNDPKIKNILYEIKHFKEEIDYNTGYYFSIDITSFKFICKSKSLLSGIFNIFSESNDYCTKEIEGKKLTYNNIDLFIPIEYIEEIISQTSRTIIAYINHIISKKIGYIDLIVFTGGLTKNRIFRKDLEEYKEDGFAEIAFMKEPEKVIMKGAALFGLKPNKILKRIIPITIGVCSYEKKESDKNGGNSSEIVDKNKYACYKYMRYIKKRESIETNQIINHKIYIINNRIFIYYSYQDDITNDNKHELGYVDLVSDSFSKNYKSVNLMMKFSNYINITVIDNNSGQMNTTLLSYPINDKFL